MATINFFILPNQLFETKHLKSTIDDFKKQITEKSKSKSETFTVSIILWEHPHFFTKFKFNKKKLVLHRASMKHYFDNTLKELEDSDEIHKRIYIEFHDKITGKKLLSKTNTKSHYKITIDPIDNVKGYTNKFNKNMMIETPNFFLTKQQYIDYRKGREPDKGFAFTNGFYPYGKKIIKHLENTKSTDHSNRDTLKDDSKVPKIPPFENLSKDEQKYIEDACEYVNEHFSKNYGTTEKFNFPISHTTAKFWLKDFVKERFELFGKYQDAIVKGNYALYHSMLSSSLNIGLINPIDVIDEIKNLDESVHKKSRIPLNSYEGFVRQLFWREYQRYCYIHAHKLIEKTNFFGFKKRLSKKWYTGKTGIEPIDDCIIRAFDSAYLHHIERLMLIGNFMTLNRISPKQGYKWFMEFSIDSYNWVMHQNVYDMVFFNSGGVTMRKPYITSSNYVIKIHRNRKCIS